MCGRYSTDGISERDLEERFKAHIESEDFQPNFNIKPTQFAPVVVRKEGHNKIEEMRWGLLPFWAKDAKLAYKTFNARAETLPEKASFKGSLKNKRALVPAHWFYEWKEEDGKKVPYKFSLADDSIFALAGLYSPWCAPSGEEFSTYTIITTTPNSLLSQVHDRMPAILPPELEDVWLDEATDDPLYLQSLLKPFDETKMKMEKVSTKL